MLARAGLSHLKDLEPIPPVLRYEHEAAGDLLHIDTKRLGRIVRPGHRVTGDRRGRFRSAGWEFLFVAIDDHARIGFTECTPMRGRPAPSIPAQRRGLLPVARRPIKRLLTDNGSAFRSKDFAQACTELKSNIALPDPTGPKPMARPSASSSQRCANGPTASSTKIPSSAPTNSMPGSITTTGTAPSGHRRRCTHVQTQIVPQQPLDASQLSAARRRLCLLPLPVSATAAHPAIELPPSVNLTTSQWGLDPADRGGEGGHWSQPWTD